MIEKIIEKYLCDVEEYIASIFEEYDFQKYDLNSEMFIDSIIHHNQDCKFKISCRDQYRFYTLIMFDLRMEEIEGKLCDMFNNLYPNFIVI